MFDDDYTKGKVAAMDYFVGYVLELILDDYEGENRDAIAEHFQEKIDWYRNMLAATGTSGKYADGCESFLNSMESILYPDE